MGIADVANSVADFIEEGLNPSESGSRERQHTRVWASFHSDEGFDGIVSHQERPVDASVSPLTNPFQEPPKRTNTRPPFKIIGFSSSKSFGATGAWTLTVKPSDGVSDLLDLWVDPEDTWVRIAIVQNGVTIDTMIGPMDTITEDLQRGGKGERVLTYTMTGQDFHKVFARTQLFINVYERDGQLPMGPLYDALQESLIGSPTDITRALIDAWLGNNGVADKQWRLPASLGGGFFFDKLDLNFAETEGKVFDPTLYSPDQFMGRTLWQTLMDNCNPMLNELFTQMKISKEFKPEKPPEMQLVLRQRPFPTENDVSVWQSLTTHILRPSDIAGRKLTKGSPESRFNYWLLDAEGVLGKGYAVLKMMQDAAKVGKGLPGAAPIYDLEDMRKHGFRRFSQSTKYLPWKDDKSWFLMAPQWIKMLHDWYAVAPFELNGTLRTNKIFPRVQLGHRIQEVRSRGALVTYYVEGWTHSWTYPGAGRSSFQVTRGEKFGSDLLEHVYARYTSRRADARDPIIQHLQALDTDELASAVPTGSDTRLDKTVGQVEPVERIYLRRRGLLDEQRQVDSGEGIRDDQVAGVTAADLPGRNISDDFRELTGEQLPPPRRTQGGNLTQRELEQGKSLPEEGRVAEPEALDRSTDDVEDRAQQRSKISRRRPQGF